AADLFGWPADELVGRRITVLIPEDMRDRHIAAFTSLLLTGESRTLGRPVRMSALHRDGRLIQISLLVQTQEARDGRSVFIARINPVQDGEHGVW
ncbi:PAS domain-containing protein, partial [Streptomyces carpinensis]